MSKYKDYELHDLAFILFSVLDVPLHKTFQKFIFFFPKNHESKRIAIPNFKTKIFMKKYYNIF